MARRASITLVLVGTLSVMIILVFSLSQRLQRHTTLLTVVDTTQIARNILESYAGDVLRFVRLNCNKPGSKLHDLLRAGAPGQPRKEFAASEIDYAPTPLLQALVKEYDGDDRFRLKLVANPKLALAELKLLPLPTMLYYKDPGKAPAEWEGNFEITVQVEFAERKYSLTVAHPYKVVFTMLPMVREFAWFFPHLSDEQKGIDNDDINLLRIREDEIKEGGQWPLILDTLATDILNDKLYKDPKQTGRVFFGRDKTPVYLNLAGENLPEEAPMSDLWMIKKSHFDLGNAGKPANSGGNNGTPNPDQEADAALEDNMQLTKMDALCTQNKAIRLRGVVLDLNAPGSLSQKSIFIKMFAVGFSDELVDSSIGFFSPDSNWKLDDFLGPDPTWSGPMGKDPKKLRCGSAIKPLGLSRDPLIAQQAAAQGADFATVAGSSPLPQRYIYGHVFRRFAVLSFYSSPSLQGYMQELVYSDNPNFHQTLNLMKTDGTRDQIDLQRIGCSYQSLMSRIVSGGGAASSGGKYPSSYQTYDVTPGHDYNCPLTHVDFEGSDGLKVSAASGFGEYAGAYLTMAKNPTSGPVWTANRRPTATLQSRITRYFPDGPTFLESAKTGGVVFVDRGLDLSKETDVAALPGGTIIVNGPLKLGAVRRDLPAGPLSDASFMPKLQKTATTLTPSQMLTFVVLNGAPITLAGDVYVGVQLVSLYDGATPINFPTQRFIYVGGLALSRPGLRLLMSRMPKQSLFYYPPNMATPNPPRTTDVDLSMRAYYLRMD